MAIINHKVIFENPKVGVFSPEDFKIIQEALPDLKDGEILLKTLYFSLDPYMKKTLRPTQAYADIKSTLPTEAIQGPSVCAVEATKNPNFKPGDIVLTYTGWQTYSISKGNLTKELPWDNNSVKPISNDVHPSYYLGALGMTGLTGYAGLMNIGHPKPGETVVVTSAAGAVGSTVGQVAKMNGCRAVGIASSPEKCRFVVDELGFDACVSYKSPSFAEDLKKACPNNIDVFFDNVGGDAFYTILSQANDSARIILCGSMAWTNHTGDPIPQGPDLLAMIYFFKIPKRLKIESFLMYDYMDTYDDFISYMIPQIQAGHIKVKENIVKGIENAPKAFLGMLEGKNKGKQIVEI